MEKFLIILAFIGPTSGAVKQRPLVAGTSHKRGEVWNVTATVGQDCSLPCSIGTAPKGELTDLLWIYVDRSLTLLVFRGEVVLKGYEDLVYTDRVHIPDPKFSAGDLSVFLKKVTAEDSGVYECKAGFEGEGVFYEKSQFVRVTVTEHDSSPGGNTYLLLILLPIMVMVVVILGCCIFWLRAHRRQKRLPIFKQLWDLHESRVCPSIKSSTEGPEELIFGEKLQPHSDLSHSVDDIRPDLHPDIPDIHPEKRQHSCDEPDLFRDYPYSCPPSPFVPSRSCHLDVVGGLEGSSPTSQTKSSSYPSLRKGEPQETTPTAPTKYDVHKLMGNTATVI